MTHSEALQVNMLFAAQVPCCCMNGARMIHGDLLKGTSYAFRRGLVGREGVAVGKGELGDRGHCHRLAKKSHPYAHITEPAFVATHAGAAAAVEV